MLVIRTLVRATCRLDRPGRRHPGALWSQLDRQFFWRDGEYRKLAELHSDYTVEKFEEVLGAPLLRRRSEDRRWEELFFRGQEDWVQAVVPANGNTVTYFSVTSCSASFKPTFWLPEGGPIKLYESTLASAGRPPFSLYPWPLRFRYAVYASSPHAYFEWYSGGHAWSFKGFAWGFNGVCGRGASANPYDFGFFNPNVRVGMVSRLPKGMKTRFREGVAVNTYAEWGLSTGYLSRWPPLVPIGVDEFIVSNN